MPDYTMRDSTDTQNKAKAKKRLGLGELYCCVCNEPTGKLIKATLIPFTKAWCSLHYGETHE